MSFWTPSFLQHQFCSSPCPARSSLTATSSLQLCRHGCDLVSWIVPWCLLCHAWFVFWSHSLMLLKEISTQTTPKGGNWRLLCQPVGNGGKRGGEKVTGMKDPLSSLMGEFSLISQKIENTKTTGMRNTGEKYSMNWQGQNWQNTIAAGNQTIGTPAYKKGSCAF